MWGRGGVGRLGNMGDSFPPITLILPGPPISQASAKPPANPHRARPASQPRARPAWRAPVGVALPATCPAVSTTLHGKGGVAENHAARPALLSAGEPRADTQCNACE